MTCCSQRRNAWPTKPPLRSAASSLPAPHSSTPAQESTQRLRYLRDAPLVLRGPFSLRVYKFDASARVLTVDVSDVDVLLRTGLFEPDVG